MQKIWEQITHPNNLTLYRVIAVPVFVILLMYPNSKVCTFLAALIFSAAAITDLFDGFLARKRGLVSNLGKHIDPLADKFLVSSAFIMLASYNRAPAWIVCIIIGRELAITGLRSIIADKGEDVSASILGKYKTGFQIAAIIPLLLHFSYFGIDFHFIGSFLLWCALFFTMWSGIDYYVRFKKFIG
ncbi:MAG: CDP-diacylglycerol--glycerol-3-phosphate 3-phosphatidyltransferase [Desulfobacterales bacterium]|nr:CDP-diacylglycerol--glycerol-3-phosphate 3-phosphatidyltransferase [Desulfobacterales bacterium]